MKPRERVLAVLNRQKPDMVPWFGDLDYWVDYLNDVSLALDKYPDLSLKGMGKDLYKLHRDLNVGFYLQGYFPFKTLYDGITVTEEIKGKYRYTTMETPVGKLEEVWQYTEFCWAPKVRLIKNWKDLKVLRYIFDHTFYEPDYDLAEKRYELIGDNGIVLVYMPRGPMMDFIALRGGIETFVDCLIDAPEELDETMEAADRNLSKAAEIALNSPAECIMIPENLSSEVVGKQYYKKYMKPYEERWVKRIKEVGKFSFIHLDGTMKGLITEVSEIGFDVIEAITPAPVGDIALEDIRKWVNDDTILWGGIPGLYFTSNISDEEFDRFVINALEIMKSSPCFVLGVGDQVPPGSSFERIKRVNELVTKYGKF